MNPTQITLNTCVEYMCVVMQTDIQDQQGENYILIIAKWGIKITGLNLELEIAVAINEKLTY